MIALIIYLTMTAKGPNKQKKATTTSHIPPVPETLQESELNVEQASMLKTPYENSATNYLSQHPEHNSVNQNQPIQATLNTNQTEHLKLEEELYVFPYPKEDKLKNEENFPTSTFKPSSQNQNEPTNNNSNQQPTNQE